MLVNHELKVLFLHIPKNGGTAFKRHLQKHTEGSIDIWNMGKLPDRVLDLSHLKPKQYHLISHLQRAMVERYTKVGFTRDPYDRFLSCYRMYKYQHGFFPKDKGIHDFCHTVHSWSPFDTYRYIHTAPQHHFTDGLTDLHLFKLEELAENLDRIAELVGVELSPEIAPVNRTPKQDVELDELAVSFVSAFYAKDFEQFGYSLR